MLTRVVIIGDSQVDSALKTNGFGSILNDRFNGGADVMVRKFPGYTAEWIKLLTGCLSRNLGSAPDYVIIMVGRDDCLRSSLDKRPVSDPDTYRKSLYSIVNKLTNEVDVKSEHIFLMSPLPIHKMKFEGNENNIFSGLKLDEWLLKAYGEKTREVAKRVGGQFIDTHDLLDAGLDANIGQNGIKITDDGHLVLAEKLVEMIELTEFPYPPYDMVGKNYEEQLDAIAKSCSMVQQENISAYTYVSTVDQYSAYFSKSYRGKV